MINVQDALNSPQFKQALASAGDYLINREKADALIADVRGKLEAMKKAPGPIGEVVEKIEALVRMLQAYVAGRYRVVPVKSLVAGVGAIIYLVSNNDLIDDDKPWVGFLDDAAVAGLALKTIMADIDAFVAWERELRD